MRKVEKSEKEIREIISFLKDEMQKIVENQPEAVVTIEAFSDVVDHLEGGLL